MKPNPPFEVKRPRKWKRIDNKDGNGYILLGGIVGENDKQICAFFPCGLDKDAVERTKKKFMELEQKLIEF